jgi:hypothetical protein
VRWILERHDRHALQFVDGWTGKGAILRVLQAAAGQVGVDPSMAVIADPGHCTSIYGTRDDFLIPHSCLNSTVSGLVSRTVLNATLIGPADFHGVKYYRHLAGRDYSRRYVDTVVQAFPTVVDAVALGVLHAEDRTPTWAGWRTVDVLARDYGITNVGFIKPGVGETTRVLLRRVPWRVIVAPDRRAELAHILSLCEAKDVIVEERGDLLYSCVGIIRPLDGRPDRAVFTVPS